MSYFGIPDGYMSRPSRGLHATFFTCLPTVSSSLRTVLSLSIATLMPTLLVSGFIEMLKTQYLLCLALAIQFTMLVACLFGCQSYKLRLLSPPLMLNTLHFLSHFMTSFPFSTFLKNFSWFSLLLQNNQSFLVLSLRTMQVLYNLLLHTRLVHPPNI